MTRTISLVTSAVAGAALALAGAAAAAPQRSYAVRYVEKFNTTRPNTPTGRFPQIGVAG